MDGRITIRRPFAILGEGDDDFHFLIHLLEHRSLDADVEVFKYDGKDRLARYLSAFVKTPGFSELKGLLITRDADADYDAAFDSVAGALKKLKLAAPPSSLEIAEGTPRIGVYIFPSNNVTGMLEDACLEAIGAHPIVAAAETFIASALAREADPATAVSKCKLHAFLATRKEPGRPIGLASKSGYIPLAATNFDAICDLIGRLKDA